MSLALPEYPEDLTALEARLGYAFKDRGLLIEALTHKSYHFEHPEKSLSYNERLEFLGDSVLGLAVAARLFRHSEKLSESMMAKIKSYVVKGAVLAEIGREMELGQYLLMGKGEEETGGRQKHSLLTNAVEALIGAVYIDGGPEPANSLVLRLFEDRLDITVASGKLHDYKTEFQELAQERLGKTPEYRLVAQSGLEHKKHFTVEVLVGSEVFGRGSGPSKKKAEQSAAREAIRRIEPPEGDTK